MLEFVVLDLAEVVERDDRSEGGASEICEERRPTRLRLHRLQMRYTDGIFGRLQLQSVAHLGPPIGAHRAALQDNIDLLAEEVDALIVFGAEHQVQSVQRDDTAATDDSICSPRSASIKQKERRNTTTDLRDRFEMCVTSDAAQSLMIVEAVGRRHVSVPVFSRRQIRWDFQWADQNPLQLEVGRRPQIADARAHHCKFLEEKKKPQKPEG